MKHSETSHSKDASSSLLHTSIDQDVALNLMRIYKGRCPKGSWREVFRYIEKTGCKDLFTISPQKLANWDNEKRKTPLDDRAFAVITDFFKSDSFMGLVPEGERVIYKERNAINVGGSLKEFHALSLGDEDMSNKIFSHLSGSWITRDLRIPAIFDYHRRANPLETTVDFIFIRILFVKGYDFAITHVVVFPMNSDGMEPPYDSVYSGYLFLDNKKEKVISIKLHNRFDRKFVESEYIIDKLFPNEFSEGVSFEENLKNMSTSMCLSNGQLTVEFLKQLNLEQKPDESSSNSIDNLIDQIDNILWDVIPDGTTE